MSDASLNPYEPPPEFARPWPSKNEGTPAPTSAPGRKTFEKLVLASALVLAVTSIFAPWTRPVTWGSWIIVVQVALFGSMVLPFLFRIVEALVTGRARHLRINVWHPTLESHNRSDLGVEEALEQIEALLADYGFTVEPHGDGRRGLAFGKERARRAHSFLDNSIEGEVDVRAVQTGGVALAASVTVVEGFPVWTGEHPQLQGLADELALKPTAFQPKRAHLIVHQAWGLAVLNAGLACVVGFTTRVDPIWFYGVSSQAALLALVGAGLMLFKRGRFGEWNLVGEAILLAGIPYLHMLT